MTTPSDEAVSVGLGESRSRTELVLEMIALRHQIAPIETKRNSSALLSRLGPGCFGFCCPGGGHAGGQALMIAKPETVMRLRRDVWSAFWKTQVGWSLARWMDV
jgi:hypothetical protein